MHPAQIQAQKYLDTTSAGSGMYVMTSYIPDQEIVLEKNENYWGESTNVDKYIIKMKPDSNTQMMTLSSGDIDVAMNMTDDTMAELEGNENVTLINAATKTVGFLMMNMNEQYGGADFLIRGTAGNPQSYGLYRRSDYLRSRNSNSLFCDPVRIYGKQGGAACRLYQSGGGKSTPGSSRISGWI